MILFITITLLTTSIVIKVSTEMINSTMNFNEEN